MSHVAAVMRRTGDTFTPIGAGGMVRPSEPVRYYASGITLASVHQPEFIVQDSLGTVVFRYTASIAPLVSDAAWVDTVAPAREGLFTLTVHAQSFPFLPVTHADEVQFSVSQNAPAPPPPPPGGLDRILKGVVLVGGVVAVGMVLMSLRRRA